MSATIYGIREQCSLNPDEITGIIEKIKDGFLYKGQDFYDEVKKLGGWQPASEDRDSVCIWSGCDDAGPISDKTPQIGLFVHFDEQMQKYDWACTYDIND